MKNYFNQSGQIAIFLMLLLLIGLTAALAITQRSVTDVSTSTQTEQSSRAFSAAEAGIEQALQSEALNVPLTGNLPISDLGNSAATDIIPAYSLPRANQAYEFPEAIKDRPSQFWLADPTYTPPKAPTTAITGFELYFGNSDATGAQIPSVEVNIVTQAVSGVYSNTRYFFDSQNRVNGFKSTLTEGLNCSGPFTINTTRSADTSVADRSFKCKVIFPTPSATPPLNMPSGTPILAIVKILYSSASQKIAMKPLTGQSLPPQSKIYTSRGNAGTSQKVLQLERIKYVIPNFLDYAVFSAGSITK